MCWLHMCVHTLTLLGAVAEGAPRTSCKDKKWEENMSGLVINHKYTQSKHCITQCCSHTHTLCGLGCVCSATVLKQQQVTVFIEADMLKQEWTFFQLIPVGDMSKQVVHQHRKLQLFHP